MTENKKTPAVMTVRGEISPEQLGMVAMSEHIFYGLPGWENDPTISFNRAEAIEDVLSALRDFKEAGGGTIVDFNGTLLGRDAELLRTLSTATGLNIVASTGLATQDTFPGHFLAPGIKKDNWVIHSEGLTDRVVKLDADHIADIIYAELTVGMSARYMINTGIKAGVVKAAASWDGMTPVEEMSIRGAACAAQQAGVSVITTGAPGGLRQLEIMGEEGLSPERIVIGRCDDSRVLDLERDKQICQKGAYVSYDHIGWEDTSLPFCITDERRAEIVKTMVADGFTEHVILSCDAVGHAISMPQTRHDYSHLLRNFVPRLKKARVPESAITTILRDNPRRVLTRI